MMEPGEEGLPNFLEAKWLATSGAVIQPGTPFPEPGLSVAPAWFYSKEAAHWSVRFLHA